MKWDDQYRRYFVTGGAGFIGSHLVERLLAAGKEVAVYDNLAAGRKENIAHVLGDPHLTFHQADALDLPRLTAAMKGYEVVWHLAANADIPGGIKKTDMDLNNGTIATRNVLEAMRSNGIENIIFSSSSTVYGDAPLVALAETTGPELPISLYGAAKLAAEGLISAYSHLFGVRGCIFRFGNVLGARMSHGVIHDFIHKLRRNPNELEVLGDGKQQKNYFLVEDCIEGMYTGFRKSEKRCDVFNLGSETTVTVTEIAKIVAAEMGLKDVKLKYTGGPRGWPGDAPYVWYDVSKMKKLGWQASGSSAEAVRTACRRLLETM